MVTRRCFWTIVLCICLKSALGQVSFIKNYGSTRGYSIKQTNDRGYIAVGSTQDTVGFGAYMLAFKTDSLGNIVWRKVLSAQGDDRGNDVELTNDSGYIIAGALVESLSCWDFCYYDAYVVKINESGDTAWTWRWGTIGLSEMVYDIEQANDGGFIVTGFSDFNGYTGARAFLAKLNNAGDTVWIKKYDSTSFAYSVQQTFDEGYVFCGEKESGGATDIYFAKTDSLGNILWEKVFYGGPLYDAGMSVQQTLDSGYIVSGYVRFDTTDLTAAYLIKTDKNGDSLWAKIYDGSLYDNAFSVQQTSDGGYILAGRTKSFGAGNSDAWLIKTDANGDTLWTKTFGGPGDDDAYAVELTSDGGYVLTGQYNTSEVWIIKTDSLGNAPTLTSTSNTLQNEKSSIKVYPNPSKYKITVEFEISAKVINARIAIYDCLGRKIQQHDNENLKPGKHYKDITTVNLQKGQYFLTINLDGTIQTIKFMKL